MRELLSGLRSDMTLEPGKKPTKEMVASIRKASADLVKLALERQH
jgi:hypothetical protein